MKLHSQNRLSSLRNVRGTNHAVEIGSGVGARSGSGMRNLTLRHVVAEDLRSVDVRHDSLGILKLGKNRSHSRHTGKRLAEVNGRSGFLSVRPQRDFGPRSVTEGVLVPIVGKRVRRLPDSALQNGRTESKVAVFHLTSNHYRLEHNRIVDILDFNPRAVTP